MAVTLDQIGDDVAATVAAVSGVRSCVYPPPEAAPVQGPSCWVDLGPIGYDMGNLEIGQVGVTITVAAPRQGDYPNEYKLVLATARAIVVKFRTNVAVAGEAMLTAPAVISRPVAAKYADVVENVTACVVSFVLETEYETVNEIAL